MLTLIAFILITWVGYLVMNLISPKSAFLERLGMAYLLGTGLFTVLIFLMSFIGIKIDFLNLILTLGLLSILLSSRFSVIKKASVQDAKRFFYLWKSQSLGEKILIFIILGAFIISIASTLYWPVNEWDALALYDFRAKIIADTGFFVQVANKFVYFVHYPLFTSLLHAIVYVFGGKNPQFTYSLIFISFVFVFYSQLTKTSSKKASLLATAILAFTPTLLIHSTISYTNLPYTVFLVLGMIYLYRFLLGSNKSDLILAGLMVGLGTWVRDTEPFWLVSFVIIIPYAFWKRKYLSPLIYLVSFLVVFYPWRFYSINYISRNREVTNQLSKAVIDLAKSIDIARFSEILAFLYKHVFLSWGVLLYLFLIVAATEIMGRIKSESNVFLIIILVNIAFLFLGTYLFSINYKGWQDIPDSATRMAMFFIPLLIFYIGISPTFNKLLEPGSFRNIFRSITPKKLI